MTAYFHITTADDRIFVGSVQGFGGQLGGGASHLGPERENAVALDELQYCIECMNQHGHFAHAAEAKEAPGHCYVKSVKDWKVPNDGAFNVQLVPLKGATARILSDEEVRAIQPGTCRLDIPDPLSAEAAKRMGIEPTNHPKEPEPSAGSTCDECGGDTDSVIGCPDGSELCPQCFDSGSR